MKSLSTLALVAALAFVGACGGGEDAAVNQPNMNKGSGAVPKSAPPAKAPDSAARTVQLSIDGMA